MLRLLKDTNEIRSAYSQFQSRLDAAHPEIFRCRERTGDSDQKKDILYHFYYLRDFDLSYELHQSPRTNPTRYWNGFMKGRADCKGTTNQFRCQINFHFHGSGTVSGAFATDSSGQLYVLHRGFSRIRVGDDNRRIPADEFFENYRLPQIIIDREGKSTRMALIGSLQSPDWLSRIVAFVEEVERIKAVLENPSA